MIRYLFLSLTLSCLLCSAASAQIIYQDTFNRTGSSTVGSTSTGAYTWIEQENHAFAFWVDNVQLVANGGGGESSGAKSGTVYVDYSLDSVVNYQIDMTAAFGVGTVASGSTRWTQISPRSNGGSSSDSSSGWRFYKTSDAASTISVGYYDAGTTLTTDLGVVSSLTAGVASSLSILVSNNSATLTIGAFTDTRTLNFSANDSLADYFQFGSSALSRGTFDNLVVTSIPEPSTIGLLLFGLAILAWLRCRISVRSHH